jgi:PPM family protein phosphatase
VRHPSRFRGHRAGDTGELEPITADLPPEVGYAIPSDPIDPEHARYAPVARPRFVWVRRLLALTVIAGLLGMGAGAARWWMQRQYYVGQQNGVVTIFRGIEGDVLGYSLSEPFESTNLTVSQLSDLDATSVTEGMEPGTLDDAERTVANLYERQTALDSGG